MTFVEEYIVSYPMRSISILIVIIAFVVWGLKRFIIDDLPTDDHRASKAHRLD